MNWFQQNRFLGTFLGALVFATLLSGSFLFHEESAADEQEKRLDATINQLNRLRASAPFPNEENLRGTRAQTDSYRTSLQALEDELKNRMIPWRPLQPNEFQAQLRQAVLAVTEGARAGKVQLPENFNLGFDEYATSLPNSVAASRLGRQLKAIEWLANRMIEARVDSLSSLTRSALPEEKAAATPTTPLGRSRAGMAPRAAKEDAGIVDSTSVSLVFTGSPAAARKVLNQITDAQEQFYIIRTLQVKNAADKGPKRGEAVVPNAAAVSQAAADTAGKTPGPGITFIVGNEHLSVAVRIEIVSFNIPTKEAR